jgi:hypothetical protein
MATWTRGWVGIPAAAACLLTSCTTSMHPVVHSPAASQPVARHHVDQVTAQHASLRGVSVAAPASWPRNDLRCGSPLHDTLVVEPAGTSFDACFDPGPGDLSVIWLAAMARANPSQPARQRYLVGWGKARLHPARIAGHRALVGWRQLHPTARPQAVSGYVAAALFPGQRAYVTVTSRDRAFVRRTIASIRVRHG